MTLSFPTVTVAPSPHELARQAAVAEEQRLIDGLAHYCRTTVTVHRNEWGDLDVELGHTVRWLICREAVTHHASVYTLLDEEAPKMRAAWFAYEPDIPSNVVLGEC